MIRLGSTPRCILPELYTRLRWEKKPNRPEHHCISVISTIWQGASSGARAIYTYIHKHIHTCILEHRILNNSTAMWMYQYNSLNDRTGRNFGCTGTAPPRGAGNMAPICLALLACFIIMMPGWRWQGWLHSIGRLSDTKGRNENRLRDRWSWECVRVCVRERVGESKCVYVDVYSSVFELLSWKCLWKCLSKFVCKCLCLTSTNMFKFVESVVACGSCPGLNKNNKWWKSFEFHAN